MNRPLWQLLLTILVVGFVLRRAALVLGFDLAEEGVPIALVAGYGVQLVAGLLAGLLVAIEHRFVLPALATLGVAIAATLGLELALLAGPSRFEIASGTMALAATVALYAGLRRAIEADGRGDSEAKAATPDAGHSR